MLMYFCATGYAQLKILNGNGKGEDISEIHKIDPSKQKGGSDMSKDDVFLDWATGDYYTYRKDLEMWAPIGNTGLHYRLAAE